ncbi:MAG: hypothetical protein ABFD60_07960 [Bryobacteraceae bacterium]
MWLARDRYGLWLYSRKPKYNEEENIFDFAGEISPCNSLGTKLRCGECVEVELRVKRKGKAR